MTVSATFDANVLASAIVGLNRPGSTPGRLWTAWNAGEFVLIASDPILVELERTFRKPYFSQRLTSAEIERALAVLRARATIITISAVVQGVASHPEDDVVLATALSSDAEYLVTGDADLLALRLHENVSIVSPRAFLNHLQLP